MPLGRRVAVAVALVTALAIAFVATRQREPSIGRGESRSRGEGQPLTIGVGPASYTVEYRLEERVADGIRVSTERLAVRRPFDARLQTLAGPPPGGKVIATNVWTLGRSSSVQGDAEPLVSDQPPQPAGGDIRLAPVLPAALRNELVELRERRQVLGRTCEVLRSGSRLVSADLKGQTGRKNYVDTCVDSDGLVLEEVQTRDSRRDLRRVAVRVNRRATIDDAAFTIAKAGLDVRSGGGSTRRIDPASSPPGDFWQLDAPPAGFTLAGRYSVVPPQPENFTDPLREGFRRAGVSDLYVRGVDVVVVDRGGTLRGESPWATESGYPAIDLGAVGRGEIVLTPRWAEVRALTGSGRYVRLFGTLPPDDLAAIARTLRKVPGTELKFLDD